tara:strand:- start:638 stop:1057 length:420 start_codon:yes stop_codon:yes gene_type:complete
MILISHRANISGPDPENENHPDKILCVLELGLDCEIDVWKIDDYFFLGHDEPKYKIDLDFLSKPNLWIHAKNFDALNSLPSKLKFFWHESDDYTLTSNNLIWTYPDKKIDSKSIIVDKNRNWRDKNYNCFGICTDYILR